MMFVQKILIGSVKEQDRLKRLGPINTIKLILSLLIWVFLKEQGKLGKHRGHNKALASNLITRKLIITLALFSTGKANWKRR